MIKTTKEDVREEKIVDIGLDVRGGFNIYYENDKYINVEREELIQMLNGHKI